jgi:MFS family permease
MLRWRRPSKDISLIHTFQMLVSPCSFQAPTMLLCEVLPRNSRGMGMYCYNIALSLGFLMSGLINMLLHDPVWGWRMSVALLAAPGVALAALLPGISESPQVLLQQGKEEAAVQVGYLKMRSELYC